MCQTLSKTSEISRNTAFTSRPLSSKFKILGVTEISWLMQEPTLLKSDRFCGIRLLSIK